MGFPRKKPQALSMSAPGRSLSPAKARFAEAQRAFGGGAASSSSASKKARFEGGGGGASAAAAASSAPQSDEEEEGEGSIYVTDEEEEEGDAAPSARGRRRGLLQGRRKATPAEVLSKKTGLYAAAMSAKTTAEKETKKARKAVEDFVQQNTGFVADTIESARTTLEDLKEDEQVMLLNGLAKGLDVSLFWRNACARGAHFFTSTPNPLPPHTRARADVADLQARRCQDCALRRDD